MAGASRVRSVATGEGEREAPGRHGGEASGRRRRLAPDARRRELLDAAVEVLARLGPDECRVEDITTAAGTAKGNFYRYFATFDDLLVAVRDHLLDRYRREVEQRLAARTTLDWWTVLEEEVDAFLDFQVGSGRLHDAVFHSPATAATPADEHRSADTLIAELLRAGIADGAFAAVDIDPTAVLLFHVLHGAGDDIAAGRDRDRARNAALHIIRATLQPTSGRGGRGGDADDQEVEH
jgi:AcrR family transcriptional regulator